MVLRLRTRDNSDFRTYVTRAIRAPQVKSQQLSNVKGATLQIPKETQLHSLFQHQHFPFLFSTSFFFILRWRATTCSRRQWPGGTNIIKLWISSHPDVVYPGSPISEGMSTYYSQGFAELQKTNSYSPEPPCVP
ncbi:uncharacterized protein UV8b_07210 [Ustilaginoidea virens]|uniref:Uncharacterized protein n=1 Tax=Ustilaginoidea virens TaxID=1159556 RepID=A0A8E5HWM3_USTVR|nr:uncharacterized protein UV8b_07210 [Ustilaginoidea virens]QUC22969.1 hypothetical protein UV8b_07210 [Ustilaginoidea virens]